MVYNFFDKKFSASCVSKFAGSAVKSAWSEFLNA